MTFSWERESDPPPPPAISPEQRRTFVAIADTLVPGDDEMPAASEVDVGGDRLDAVLRSRPDLAAPLLAALEEAPATGMQRWVDDLAVSAPTRHRSLVVAILATYYLSVEVRRRLGYPGQTSSTVNIGFPAYVDEGLLDAVIARGPIHRTVEEP